VHSRTEEAPQKRSLDTVASEADVIESVQKRKKMTLAPDAEIQT